MSLCFKVFACLSATSCVSEGAEAPESFLNLRARIDGFHSQNARMPTPAQGQLGAHIHMADLTHVKAKLNAMKAQGFSNMSTILQNNVENLNLKVNGAACEADIFAEGWRRPYGFGSRALVAANEIQLAAVFGLSITVCGGEFAQDTWANHFQNLAGISICAAEVCSGDTQDFSEAASLGVSMSKELSLVDPESLFKLKHIIFHRMYTYNSASMAAVNRILEAVPVDIQKPYVGVHIRRGDKETEADPTPMSSYATAALEQMDILGLRSRTVFVASDDPRAGSMLAEEFAATGHPDVQVLQQHHASPLPDEYGRRDYSDDDDDGTMDLLADIEGLRLATVFIGTQSSSLGRMIFYLREEMVSSISLDGGWFDSAWV